MLLCNCTIECNSNSIVLYLKYIRYLIEIKKEKHNVNKNVYFKI